MSIVIPIVNESHGHEPDGSFVLPKLQSWLPILLGFLRFARNGRRLTQRHNPQLAFTSCLYRRTFTCSPGLVTPQRLGINSGD